MIAPEIAAEIKKLKKSAVAANPVDKRNQDRKSFDPNPEQPGPGLEIPGAVGEDQRNAGLDQRHQRPENGEPAHQKTRACHAGSTQHGAAQRSQSKQPDCRKYAHHAADGG